MNATPYDRYPHLRAGLPFVAMAAVLGLLPVRFAWGEVIGHWTFNEGSGTTALDSTTNANHGVISGGAAYVATPGATGISLDGLDDSVNFGSPALFNFTSESFSIAAWVAINTDVAQANNEWIFGKLDSSYRLGYKEDNGAKRITRSLFSNDTGESPGGEMTPAFSFHHIVLTKSTINPSRVYIDGVDEPFFNGGGYAPIADNAGVDLVAGQGGGNNLECIIDELVIYDEQLSAAAVSSIFAAGPISFPTVAVSRVSFTDAASLCFASEVDFVYALQCADQVAGPYTNTGATITGTGNMIYVFDPPVDAAIATTRFYRVRYDL